MKKEFYLASYPRSGNTFTRLLLEHHFDIDSREMKGRILRTAQAASRPTVERIAQVRQNTEGIAYKTHNHEKEDHPALVVVRDGRDAVVSYAHFQVEVMKSHNTVEHELTRLCKLATWSDFYKWWVGGRPVNGVYCLVRYEQLRQWHAGGSAARNLQKALAKLGYDFEIINDEPLPGFEKYHKEHPQFFRRGIVGGWRDEMSEELEELFWKSNGETMQWLGYER